jgi:hypothetical protein
MRKVLLATTALVAMSVTAAQADVSISGNQNFEILDDGATSTWTIDGDVQIVGSSTTDSGLNLTAAHNINTTTGGVDDSYLDISGDFGSFRAGNTDDALDRMDGAYPANWDESGNTDGGFAIGGDKIMASFMAPTISGVTVYGASTAEGAYTGMGVNYSNGPIAVIYQSGTDGTTDKSLMAVNVTMAGATIGFGTGDQDAAGTKTEYSSMGLKYAVNDALSIYAVSQKQKGNSTASSLGGYYTVAPGLQVAAETATDASDVTSTYAHLKVSF